MPGFLSKLEKKGPKSSLLGGDLIVVQPPKPEGPSPEPAPESPLLSSEEALVSVEALFAELERESEGKSPEPPPPVPPQQKPLDDSAPWWLTDDKAATPQVDLLVPAGRLALNELLTEDEALQRDMPAAIKRAVHAAAARLSSEVRFSARDIQDAVLELSGLLLGKGPLQPLYDDPAVTDIHIDRYDSIKCVRRGQALETPFRFRSPGEYEAYVTSMLQSVERVLNLSSPIVDCVLNDAWRSRINAVHYSLLDGKESSIVIRVPRLQQISFYDLLRTKTLPPTLAAWLAELVACGEANILVLGPTGSGKTTLTTALLSAVGSDERICTIEDVPEIFVPTAHLEKLVSRPENSQGEGAVGMERLLRAALRRAPHRIVVGEIRDREGPLFLKALETGHSGSVATIHADNPNDGLWRLLDVVSAYEASPQESIQRRIARSVHVLIAVKKVNGRPCLTEVSEALPPSGGDFRVRQIARFEGEARGSRRWRLVTRESFWLDKLRERGFELQPAQSLLPPEGEP